MRPLFRACLISLTMSDIITAVFMYTNYMSQMTNALSGVWVISRPYEQKKVVRLFREPTKLVVHFFLNFFYRVWVIFCAVLYHFRRPQLFLLIASHWSALHWIAI